jgi:nucleoside 2-deoxyribosyltransferase
MKKYVYLAGPIEGCNTSEILDWRQNAFDCFTSNVQGINPFRAEEDVKSNESAKRVITKNYMDTQMCDGILAYLPKEFNDRRPSYGTVMEIAWGFSLQKPVWVVSDDDFVHGHPLISQSSMMFREMDDAIDHINVLFGEYDG